MKKILIIVGLLSLIASEANALFLKGGATQGGGVLLQPLTAEDGLLGLTAEDGTTSLTAE